jgi:hypothetical protein
VWRWTAPATSTWPIEGNDEIRKITPSGVVTTLAGSAGQIGSSDGTGSAARFNNAEGVAVDSAGNVYVADTYNYEIRKISPSGVVTTLAGTAGQIGSSDGAGSAARFYEPFGVAVDSAGNVYVADHGNAVIRKISVLFPGDTAAFTETFDTPNAGTGKTLTPAGSVNDGNGGNNYAVTVATNSAGQIEVRAITGHRGRDHQDLRRFDLLGHRAGDHRRPRHRRHRGLYRNFRHQERGHGQDAHRRRLGQRRQWRRQLCGDLCHQRGTGRSRRGRSRSPRLPAPNFTTARRLPQRPRRRSRRRPRHRRHGGLHRDF